MRYTYSDEEGIDSDATTSRRSTRNTGTHTPAEAGPTITQSGRQVKSRHGGVYGESMLSGAGHGISVGGFDGGSDDPSHDEDANGRPPRRAAATNGRSSKVRPGKHIEGYNDVDEMTSDEGDASEQDYGDDEEEDDNVPLESEVDDQDELSDEDEDMEDSEPKKLIVKLNVKTPTPEQKTPIKLRFSPHSPPEKEHAKSSHSETNDGNPAANTISTTAKPAAFEIKDGIRPVSAPASKPLSTNGLDTSTKPITIPPKSPGHPAAPLSPLAFRGSPEKKAAFIPSIGVGH